MIRTAKQARALVAEAGRLPLSGPGSLVTAIAGPVRGSWWAHEKGALIFRIASALHEDADIVSLKFEGRVQFVHRRLWPALLRVAKDSPRPKLSSEARRLLAAVERDGVCRDASKARKELEAALLVRADQEHTAEGHHAPVLESWDHFAKRTGVAAAECTAAPALELLRGCCTSRPSTPARQSRSPSPPRRPRRRSRR